MCVYKCVCVNMNVCKLTMMVVLCMDMMYFEHVFDICSVCVCMFTVYRTRY